MNIVEFLKSVKAHRKDLFRDIVNKEKTTMTFQQLYDFWLTIRTTATAAPTATGGYKVPTSFAKALLDIDKTVKARATKAARIRGKKSWATRKRNAKRKGMTTF